MPRLIEYYAVFSIAKAFATYIASVIQLSPRLNITGNQKRNHMGRVSILKMRLTTSPSIFRDVVLRRRKVLGWLALTLEQEKVAGIGNAKFSVG